MGRARDGLLPAEVGVWVSVVHLELDRTSDCNAFDIFDVFEAHT